MLLFIWFTFLRLRIFKIQNWLDSLFQFVYFILFPYNLDFIELFSLLKSRLDILNLNLKLISLQSQHIPIVYFKSPCEIFLTVYFIVVNPKFLGQRLILQSHFLKICLQSWNFVLQTISLINHFRKFHGNFLANILHTCILQCLLDNFLCLLL